MDERRGMHAVADRDEFDEFGEIDRHDFVVQDDSTVVARPTETWHLLAEQLEPRINGMSHAVEGLRVAPYQVLRAGGMQICDPVNDLRVKVEAVRWMLRIAKHLNGVAREMVMGTVSKSVEDLEFVIETQTRALAQRAAA